MPNGRKATYLRIVCANRPEKQQPRRVRHTIGGNQINYPGSTSTKTADLTTVKTLFNSVISTPDGCFMTVDLKDFFLGTPLEDRYEYIRIPDMFQDYVVRFSKKIGHFCHFAGGKLGTPTRLSNFVPRTVAWYGYTRNNVASIPMPYKKDKL
jgi:hypothetical protein